MGIVEDWIRDNVSKVLSILGLSSVNYYISSLQNWTSNLASNAISAMPWLNHVKSFFSDIPGWFNTNVLQPVVVPVQDFAQPYIDTLSTNFKNGITVLQDGWSKGTDWAKTWAVRGQQAIQQAGETLVTMARQDPLTMITTGVQKVWNFSMELNKKAIQALWKYGVKPPLMQAIQPHPLLLYYAEHPQSLIPIAAGVAGTYVGLKGYPVFSASNKVKKKVKKGWKSVKKNVQQWKSNVMGKWVEFKSQFTRKSESGWDLPESMNTIQPTSFEV